VFSDCGLLQRSLDGLLEVLSSDKAGDSDIDGPLGRYVCLGIWHRQWRPNEILVSIRQELDSLVLARGKDEEEIRSKCCSQTI
jgi:hypothetical protein